MAKDIIVIFKPAGLALDTRETAGKAYCDDKLLDAFQADPRKAMLHFGFEDRHPDMSESLSFLHGVCQSFVSALSRDPDIEITKAAKEPEAGAFEEMLRGAPYAVGAEHISEAWFAGLWGQLGRQFAQEIKAWGGPVASYLTTHNSKLNVAGRVYFHLVENKSDRLPFAFLATYSTETAQKNKAAHVPLKNALLEFRGKQDLLLGLLSTVSKAADSSAFISELVESGELFSPLRFSAEEAYTFLKEIPLYEECGIMCRMPDWWKKRSGSLKVSVAIGGSEPSKVGIDALVSVKPSLVLDGEEVTKEEIEALMAQMAGLSLLKGKWVEVDHEKLKAALDAYEMANSMGDISLADAMRMELGLMNGAASGLAGLAGGGDGDGDGGGAVEVTSGQWLRHVRGRLADAAKLDDIEPGGGFLAELRHYQQSGFNWLAYMKSIGFGALLADDMGLGKTVQILALLEYLRANGGFKALLVIPASLIGNWRNELARFAPQIRYTVLHSSATATGTNAGGVVGDAHLGVPPARAKGVVGDAHLGVPPASAKAASANTANAANAGLAADGDFDLYITTYGMALRLESLGSRKWDIVILDEAQAIKNPAAGQTKAVKRLDARFRIAMTGTPIENRLGDLWSLFDFLNAGLLGTAREFSAYAKKLKESGSYARLRGVVSPFILRRLKTDKSIISDLPDKVEIKAYTTLSAKQKLLYRGLVDELEDRLMRVDAEGIERKGVVLAAIMKFKQICNHPDQYLGQTAFKKAGSGKFEKLEEICGTIREKHERVLVFTQFREMAEPLAGFLATVFGRGGLVLHGGTPVKRRAEMVERFNGGGYVPFMVLSLKAGGVGLNLAAANHVIHFDRWWNPAVENQATDRAFRIGQTKDVMVHKFITAGTVEDKIDAMIEDKQRLSGDIVAASGENWITEMDDASLMKLVRLGV